MTRRKIGIIFNFSAHWTGGVNYIINIINTLSFLDDEEKPEIIVFYNFELEQYINEIKFPYIRFIEWKFPSVLIGTMISLVLRRNVFIHRILKEHTLDALFPLHDLPVKTRTKTTLLTWWADLQHKHYPAFFTRAQILGREVRIVFSLHNADALIVSSYDVLNDFKKYYEINPVLKTHVYRFVSILNEDNNLQITDLRVKYGLPEKYFMVSNQFHKHKNHRIVLQALVCLKEVGIKDFIVFTGGFPKDDKSEYLMELRNIINDNDLQDQILFLGVIPRSHQIAIMANSQAVIQPSLFEGWSTVIEDAISLQVPVIASDLKVNVEQLNDKGIYFDPGDSAALALVIRDFPCRRFDRKIYEDHSVRTAKAATELIKILNNQ